MAAQDVWETMYRITGELIVGDGSFEDRLWSVFSTRLVMMRPEDAPPELRADWEWLLDLCRQHLIPGVGMRTLGEMDRIKFGSVITELFTRAAAMREREFAA